MFKNHLETYLALGYEYKDAMMYAQQDANAEMGIDSDVEEITFESRYPAVVKWLTNYNGNFDFYLSVKSQYEKKGFLSDKQRESIERAIARDNTPRQVSASNAEVLWSNPTFTSGSVLKISKGFATVLAEKNGFTTPFRKLEVIKTHAETSKAVYVTVKFSTQVGCFCGICGRKLTHPVSKATGIGPECAEKMGIERYSMDAAKEVLDQISAKLTAMGEVKTWIPRSVLTKQEV